jgi:hypothetical protein
MQCGSSTRFNKAKANRGLVPFIPWLPSCLSGRESSANHGMNSTGRQGFRGQTGRAIGGPTTVGAVGGWVPTVEAGRPGGAIVMPESVMASGQ